MPRPRKTTLVSFKHAFEGIGHSLRAERRMRIHLSLAALVMVAGAVQRLSREQWFVLFIAITMVLIVDMMRSAVSACVDLFTEKFHPTPDYARAVTDGATILTDLLAFGMITAVFLISPF